VFDPAAPARGYALLWPRELFRAELAAILGTLRPHQQHPALELLLDEALRGPDPLEDLAQAPRTWPDDPWGATTTVADPQHEFGRRLLEHVDALRAYVPRRYYWDRHLPAEPAALPTGRVDDLVLQRAWAAVCEDLVERGYLNRLAGSRCEDGQENEQPQRIVRLIKEHCGLADAWPFDFDAGAYAPEHFLTLVEVFHDLVARPRTRYWHDYDDHYGYDLFDENAGQAVYRWKTNELLVRHEVDLELVGQPGDEQGQVVRRTPDPRQELLAVTQQHVPDGNEDRVGQAVALYRSRHATPEDKRRACRELAEVLESRRKTVLARLADKDSGSLFDIANRFAIRHHRDDQMYGYDPAFLDWIFWWYLATVELTNRLLVRSESSGGKTPAP